MQRRAFLGLGLAIPFPALGGVSIANVTRPGAVSNPYGLRIGPDGALYVCEVGNHRVSRVDLASGRVSTVVDGQQEPYELQFDERGNLLFVDMKAHRVLMKPHGGGPLRVVAGTGAAGFSGDGGAATDAQLNQPHSIAMNPDGRLLICDIGNHRIRAVDLRRNRIETFAGTGERAATADGALVGGSALNGPRAIDFDREGNLWLALREGNVVLCARGGKWRRVAGTGETGYSGDGGPAVEARLSGPKGIACARDGSVYLADTESHTIRRIDGRGVIETVAGTGRRGDGPVGDPKRCGLSRPHGVFAAADGRVFVGDSEAGVVRVLAGV